MSISYPQNGRFGEFGGQYVPETLVPALHQLERAFLRFRNETRFKKELNGLLSNYAGRPTPLYFAANLTNHAGGAKIFLKREDLLHSGAHKINNTLGQALLAKRMGKSRVIAETGAGQHGVATAMACAVLGLKAEIYMGSEDVKRQKINAFRMDLLGARLHSVETGTKTLKDAINEALRDWTTNVRDTYYLVGSAVGPHPYPVIIRNFQSVIGSEIKRQMMKNEGEKPNALVACVGGGSNAIGTFHEFIDNKNVELIGVQAGGLGAEMNAAPLVIGRKGVLHGMLTYLLQDQNGQIKETHSISAGLDYPGVGPEHSYLRELKRAKYVTASDQEAVDAFHTLSKLEGIIPALESAHAVSYAIKLAREMKKDETIVVTLSGRGDKDVQIIADRENIRL